MFPPGHLAFSYLAARPTLRRQPTGLEFASLTAGTLFPSASNVFLHFAPVLGINPKWSHSPVMLAGLAAMCAVVFLAQVPYRRLYLLFVIGIASHLLADYIFDFPLLYFSAGTDDIGGWWLFPIARAYVDGPQLDPGLQILPWYLIFEAVVLLGAVALWRRLDLAAYALIVIIVSFWWLGYTPSFENVVTGLAAP